MKYKYIKKIDSFEVLNEDISWKQLILGLGIIYGLNAGLSYFNSNNITSSEKDLMIKDIRNKPTYKENILLKEFKDDLLNDIRNTKNLSKDKKDLVISEINNINFVCVNKKNMELITNDERTMACYFRHFDENGKINKVIIVDKDRLNGLGSRQIVIHELRHLVDDILAPGDKLEYSEVNNLVNILDKDIVEGNAIGKAKLKEKIDFYSTRLVEIQLGVKRGNDSEEEKNRTIEYKKLKEKIFAKHFNTSKRLLTSMFSNKEDAEYLTSPSEVYVRFHGLKRWMIKNGYLKDINDEITQDKIIAILSDIKLIGELTKNNLDFLEFIFYLKVDFTNKTKSDLSKLNSIVTNYTDYTNRVV